MTNIQYLDDVIEMFSEEANDEDLRSAKNRPNIKNSGTGMDQLVIPFDGNTHKSENQLFRIEK